uniref:BZIP domain-containing protein n=1 Tax=Brassica campestris TaxID=3711 RepID=M4DLD5_BRACM
MPPYGTPTHPYVTMYPPRWHVRPSFNPSANKYLISIEMMWLLIISFNKLLSLCQGSYPYSPYAMPSPNGMTEASGNTTGGTEVEAKQSEMKEKLPIKRSRGGSLGSLNIITGKNSGASANGAYSKSAMIIMICDSDLLFNPLYNSGSGGSANGPRDGSVGCQTVPVMPMTAAGVPAPPTNLAECDELAQRAEVLNEENASLREEINKLRSQCEELTSENNSLKDQLLSFPTLEGVAMDKDEQEPPDTNQTGVAETKADSSKDSK